MCFDSAGVWSVYIDMKNLIYGFSGSWRWIAGKTEEG